MDRNLQRLWWGVVVVAVMSVAACGGGAEEFPSPSSSTTAVTDSAPSSVAPSISEAPGTVSGDPGGRKVVVDTDMSTDDLMAIAMLVGSDDVEIAAISIVGAFVRCPRGEEVMLGFLASLGVEGIPVACGPSGPISGDRTFPEEWRDAADRAWGVPLSPVSQTPDGRGGVEVMRSAIRAGATTVVMLGPQTNLARLIRESPEVVEEIELMLTMGGAVDVPGNVYLQSGQPPQAAEWNMYVDPVAANEVFGSGISIVMVGLDATNAVPVTGAFVQRLRAEGTGVAATLIADMIEQNKLADAFDSYFWDGLAVAYLIDQAVVRLEEAGIRVVTEDGPDSGRTLRDAQGAVVSIAVGGDQTLFEEVAIASLSGR